MVLCTTSLDVKVQRRTAAVPFCTIISGSAWISMADAGCDTAKRKKATIMGTVKSPSQGLDLRPRPHHTDTFEPQLVETLCS